MSGVDPLAFFSQAGPDGVSVRSHLTELIHKLLLAKSDDALEKLESTSLEVKANHFDASGRVAKPQLPVGSVQTPESGAAVPTEAWLKSAKGLHMGTDPAVEIIGYTAELPSTLPLFQWAGVGLSTQEAYRTYLAMHTLKSEYGLSMVRFFGKIFGVSSDYVIVEGIAEPGTHITPTVGEGETPPEAPGVGLNKCVYFVAPSAASEFTLLPDVTPAQVLASMKIRKLFTGNLGANVACYPAFPGAEAEYLRAQIARIGQATVVVPQGRIIVDEESEAEPKPLIANPEYAVPESLPGIESWAHGYGGILKIGRCTNVPKPPLADGEEEAEAEELEDEVPPLGSVADDAPVVLFSEEEGDNLPAWSTALHNTLAPAYAVAVAKSNRWPGAYAAIAKTGDKAACIYFGSGHEAAGKVFTPAPPPPIAAESAETEEATEVGLAEENELLQQIDQLKLEAANAEGDPAAAE